MSYHGRRPHTQKALLPEHGLHKSSTPCRRYDWQLPGPGLSGWHAPQPGSFSLMFLAQCLASPGESPRSKASEAILVGSSLQVLVFDPRFVRNVEPDILAHPGSRRWQLLTCKVRAAGGYSAVRTALRGCQCSYVPGAEVLSPGAFASRTHFGCLEADLRLARGPRKRRRPEKNSSTGSGASSPPCKLKAGSIRYLLLSAGTSS